MQLELNPTIAAGVVAATAVTDALYVMFTAAAIARRPDVRRELERRLVCRLLVCRDQLPSMPSTCCSLRWAPGSVLSFR
jgi:hypothetical protein